MRGRTFRQACFICLLLVTGLGALCADTPIEQFQSLQQEIRKSRSSKDWRANVANGHKLEIFLNESPESLLEAARADVHRGDLRDALDKVNAFVRMGQSTELLQSSPDFAPLRGTPGFQVIETRMSENRTPISLASPAYRLSDAALLPEDLDYDSQTRRFLITSVREKKIVALDAAGMLHDFAKSPDDWPMMALRVDQRRRLVWATEVALRGFVFAPESAWGRSAILCFDLEHGTLLSRLEGPHGSALGDMALAGNGDLILSDGDGGGLYRLRSNARSLQRIDGADFISPQTSAVLPDGEYILVPDYLRGIGLFEIATKKVRWLSTQAKFALNGIDGLYYNRGTLMATQNGTNPERVIAFTVSANFSKVTSEKVIERSTKTLGDPTHGVFAGRVFYYIANSGWDVIDDHGHLKPGAKLTEARIMRIDNASDVGAR